MNFDWKWKQNTGEPPVRGDTFIVAKRENGEKLTGCCSAFSWEKHHDNPIVSWMLKEDFTKSDEPSTTGEHYKKKGTDLIDHWQKTNETNTARAKIVSQIERYCSRYGKKDDALIESRKILDYATRLNSWEEEMHNESKTGKEN